MASAGQQFLASASLTLDQQGRIEWRHAPRLAHHSSHDLRALKDTVEPAQLLLAHVVDALTDTVGAVQREYGAGQGFAVIVLGLQGGDIGQEHIALDLDPQAIDARLVGPHELRQVEVFGVT
ncbi:hypothetical protein D3C76_955850 [compost metagenome]